MEVILKQDVANLGRIGDLVRVKNGYARNFLLPRQLAVVASTSQKAAFEHQKRLVEAHKKKVRKASEERLKEFEGIRVTIEKRLNESGKMFGSVSSVEVVTELHKKGLSFDRSDIELESIKTPGTYTAKLRLPGDVFAEIKVDIKGIEDSTEKKTKKTGGRTAKKAEAGTATEAAAGDTVPLKRAKKAKTESETPEGDTKESV